VTSGRLKWAGRVARRVKKGMEADFRSESSWKTSTWKIKKEMREYY
jgi:hypothetical protein